MSITNFISRETIIQTLKLTLIAVILFNGVVFQGIAYDFNWQIDETPEGSESATVIQPVQVVLLDEVIQVPSYSASLRLMQKYSVYLSSEWDAGLAYRLLKTFETVPQQVNNPYEQTDTVPASLWRLTDNHVQDDITVEFINRQTIVTIAAEAFTHADPLLAEIDGVRGRFFSKRLHQAVVRFVTDNGADRMALERILQERYAVSLNVPDYTELTSNTTAEHAERFTTFKNEELIAIATMFEEYPQGMHKIAGLKYLVRRLDGTPHPLYPSAPAVAWTTSGYIEFMESAFQAQGSDYINRLILHEKAHFLWEHLFDDQLIQDWIELGGWYENPDDTDGWSTTKQHEFVSAYAHGKNPNEDMAESISFYIVNPDKLRSRAPAKYQFIQDRVMHGTRYISKIREDLTFEVYNLYPDVMYPGRIIRVDIQVNGEPMEDKQVVIELELHKTGDLDTAQASQVRILSPTGTFFDLWLFPIGSDGESEIGASHLLRGGITISRFAADGYWAPDAITLTDAQGNERHESQVDFGWKLYMKNPLADKEAPTYVKNSMKLSLSEGIEDGRRYHILTARWQIREDNEVTNIYAQANDVNDETYSRRTEKYGTYNKETGEATVELVIPDYYQTGTYAVNYISMTDIGLNQRGVYFTKSQGVLRDEQEIIDELPATIEVETINPDSTPPVLDLNRVTVTAVPTNPEQPNGETQVDITFRVKDNISGYSATEIYLRDPHGVMHFFRHYHDEFHKIYFSDNPAVYATYHKTIILPVGSIPGTWGIAQMTVTDKAQNKLLADFTEIVRFEIESTETYSQSDVNRDGVVNILDLILVAKAFGAYDEKADVNGDGVINILDLVQVASNFGDEVASAPSALNLTADQIQSWLIQAVQVDDGSPVFRRGVSVLQNLLHSLRPKTTALLLNYPNPFNPETWIPYQLANPSEVRITIYDVRGNVVRQLGLGRQPAGFYTNRSRAAHWDGRNAYGESVANGVYFYQLQADKMSILRKMVILK